VESEITFKHGIPEDVLPEAGRAQAFDGVVNVFADMRLNANRLMLFVMFFQAARDDDAAATAARAARNAATAFRGGIRMAYDPDALPEIHSEAGAWFQAVAAEVPRAQDTFIRFCSMGEAIVDRTERDASMGDAVSALIDFAITRLNTDLEAFSQHLARERQRRRLEEAQEIITASKDVSDALGTMKRAADIVKSISINARIEAARIGDLGRGFDVISTEITANTERTLTACHAARNGIAAVLSRFSTDRAGD